MALPSPFPVDAVVDGDVISVVKFGAPTIANINFLDGIVEGAIGNAALDTRITANEASISTLNSGKVPTTRTLTAGTGLTGGGTLAADRTFAVDFGTAAGKVTQGNDTRVTITQDATIGNSALGTRMTTAESSLSTAATIKATRCRYWRAAAGQIAPAGGGNIVFDTAEEAVGTGITYNSSTGVFTISAAGTYNLSACLYINVPASSTINYWLSIMSDTADIRWALDIRQYTAGASNADFSFAAAALDVPLAAGSTIKANAYAVNTAGTNQVINIGSTPARRSVNFAIQRIS
jgi:hypothetical protein